MPYQDGVMRSPLSPEEPRRRDPIKMALAVGLAGAILVLAICLGCGGLIALSNANAPDPTPAPTYPTSVPTYWPTGQPTEGGTP